MANSDRNTTPAPRGRASSFLRLPFRNSSSSASSFNNQNASTSGDAAGSSNSNVLLNIIPNSVVSFVRSHIPALRLLKLDPSDKLYFPFEPGSIARSAIKITNTSKSHVAYKFQFMSKDPFSCICGTRHNEKILAPGASIITTVDLIVFGLIKHPKMYQKQVEKKRMIEFRILSLKVQGLTDNVAQLFVEKKHKVIVQQKLKIVFLDTEHPSDDLEKLKQILVEADAANLESSSGTSSTKPVDEYEGRVRGGIRYEASE